MFYLSQFDTFLHIEKASVTCLGPESVCVKTCLTIPYAFVMRCPAPV
jgi:hypothetical protein